MILQFYSICQQAAADSWNDLLLLESEFTGIAPGVFTRVVAKYSHPNLCHWAYCRLSFHSRAPRSRIRLDANAIVDG
jgi:hypothetical protein